MEQVLKYGFHRVERSVREPPELDLTEPLQTPRQRGVIRDREIDLEQLCQATEEALGLAKRKMKDHADRQRGLDRDVRIGALAAWFSAGCLVPGIERFIRKPDREVATLPQAILVLGPIPDAILRLRVLVLASLRILHGC